MDPTANFHIGAGALSIAGQDVGLTTEKGVIVKYNPDIHLHTSGKYGTSPVKASLVGQMLTLEIEMAEHTLTNILHAYGGTTGDAGVVQFGGLAGRQVDGKELILTPFDGTHSWYFRNAVPTGSVDANYEVKNERIVKATFTALVDIAASESSNLGYTS